MRTCVKNYELTCLQFRFVYDEDWLGPGPHVDPNDVKTMSALYNYSEPFSSECRAFGRMQEAGYDDLAVGCLGYLLLDEEHEHAMMSQFSDLGLEFNGNIERPGDEDVRSRFLGKDGRPPPIRGIVKEFGPGDETLRARDMRRILGDVVRLQQLSIIHIDVADRQIIGGKFCDFSIAITVPHFVTTPELNPGFTPESISAMKFETFQFSINDYWDFDWMVLLWNEEHEDQKDISFHAFSGGRGCRVKYDLRSTRSRERVYSLVDPRLYDWRTSAGSPENSATESLSGRKSGRRTKGNSHGRPRGAISKRADGSIPNHRGGTMTVVPRWRRV